MPLVATAYAATEITSETTEWSGEMTLTGSNVTIESEVTLNGNTTLKVAEGKTLTLKDGINCDGYTLTISGPGTVNVHKGENYTSELDSDPGIQGDVILNGGKLNVSGGYGSQDGGNGIQGNVTMNGGTMLVSGGGSTMGGGNGIKGKVIMGRGTLKASGGYGNGGGHGVNGEIYLNGGTLTATGGESFGAAGDGVSGKVDINGGTLTAIGGKGDDFGGKGIQGNVTQNGGTLDAIGGEGTKDDGGKGIWGDVKLNGGTLTVTGGTGGRNGGDGIFGDVTLNGGTLKATAGTGSTPGLTFNGCDESIVKIINNKVYTIDGTQSFSRTLSDEEKAAIAGKTFGICPAVIGETYYPTIQAAMDAADGGDTVKLLIDVETYSTVTVSKNCILDLNGHVIDAKHAFYNMAIYILPSGDLTLIDSSDAKTGLITGVNKEYGSGGGVGVNEGDFTMKGGTISGNKAQYGGGVYVYHGTFTMDGGVINGNNADLGGGVFVEEGDFTMKDGTIIGNSANQNGCGVFVYRSTFKISGGTIIDNKKRSGKVQNAYLGEEASITIPEELKGTTSIGVTTDTKPTAKSPVRITSGWNTYMNGKDPSLYFKSDDPRFLIALNGDGEAELRAVVYSVNVKNGNGSGSYIEGEDVTIKAKAPASGKQFKEWKGTDGLIFTSGSKTSSEATFTMPAQAVTVEAFYEDIPKVKAPSFTPGGGTFTSAQSVTISSETPDADIFYTLDGSDPTATSGTPYSEPVSVTKTLTIKAIAVKPGMRDSDISSATYTIGSDTPVTTGYQVTVNYGTGDGEYEENETVTIKAEEPAEGKVFDKWTSEDGVVFADETSPETTFRMPAKDVEVTATYKDKKKPLDKVPATGDEKPASSADNFAPVADRNKISKMQLDFSKVKESDVDPSGLKMTVIKGSKLTTAAKIAEGGKIEKGGGVKVKVNKKKRIATITCKNTGWAKLPMEDGVTYTVNFTVDRPKAKKLTLKAGSGQVIKTIKELFNTDIDSGTLTAKSKKNASKATVSADNTHVINPDGKDTIKVQYKYLNKKYKMSIKVK